MNIQEALQFWKDCKVNGTDFAEARTMAVKALQEQAERKKGCDFCNKELDDYPYITAINDIDQSNTCYDPAFCPMCGKRLK